MRLIISDVGMSKLPSWKLWLVIGIQWLLHARPVVITAGRLQRLESDAETLRLALTANENLRAELRKHETDE